MSGKNKILTASGANNHLWKLSVESVSERSYTIFAVPNKDGTKSMFATNFTTNGYSNSVTPDFHYKGEGQADVIGYVRTHQSSIVDHFSFDDKTAIYKTSMGCIIWMNNSNVSATSLDMIFFGICFVGCNYIPLLRSGLSWNYATNYSDFVNYKKELL